MHVHTIQLNIEKTLGGCAAMDATEFGAYMSLIITCYQTNNDLPNDDTRLARMARVTPKTWKRIKPIVAKKFSITDGKWSHDVVQKELQKYSRLSTKNKANRLKGNKKSSPVVNHSCDQTPTNTSNNHQVTSNKDKLPPIIPQGVDADLWKEFLSDRKRLKCSNSPRALKAIENKLDSFAKNGHDPNNVILTTIEHGWKTVYEPKEKACNGKSVASSGLMAFGGDMGEYLKSLKEERV